MLHLHTIINQSIINQLNYGIRHRWFIKQNVPQYF
jgi:hypothetical protein